MTSEWWLALRSGRVVNASSLDQIFSPTRLRRNGIEADFGYGLGEIGEVAPAACTAPIVGGE